MFEVTCIKLLVMRLSILFGMHIQRITHHILYGKHHTIKCCASPLQGNINLFFSIYMYMTLIGMDSYHPIKVDQGRSLYHCIGMLEEIGHTMIRLPTQL